MWKFFDICGHAADLSCCKARFRHFYKSQYARRKQAVYAIPKIAISSTSKSILLLPYAKTGSEFRQDPATPKPLFHFPHFLAMAVSTYRIAIATTLFPSRILQASCTRRKTFMAARSPPSLRFLTPVLRFQRQGFIDDHRIR